MKLPSYQHLQDVEVGHSLTIPLAGRELTVKVLAINEEQISVVCPFLTSGDPFKTMTIRQVDGVIS